MKIHDPGKPLATEPERARLLQLLLDSALESDLSKSVLNLGPDRLIRRYLPPGTYSDLYHLYVSFQTSKNLKVSSPSTFYRVLESSGWKRVIKFRPVSQHSACTICQKLKARIRHSRDVSEHAQNSDLLMRHLTGQFLDRSTYWSYRTRAKRDMDILTVITDSMDRGKFVVPRYLDSRTPKDVANLNRPSCEVTASMIHGRMIYVAVADEGEGAGSSWVLEVLSRSLDSAYCQAQRKGWCWPSVLKIFADNTPKDINVELILSSFSNFAFASHNPSPFRLVRTHNPVGVQEWRHGIMVQLHDRGGILPANIM